MIEGEAAGDGSLVFWGPDGTSCDGIYRCTDGTFKACGAKLRQMNSNEPRRVTLYTINHGPISIMQLDWLCGRCGFRNVYRINMNGIFSSRYGVPYVELMYWWRHEMCANTNSFRAVYDSVTKLYCYDSYNYRSNTGRLAKLRVAHTPNRRIGNEAMRKFISAIDIESHDVCKKLYSCDKGDVALEKSDRLQLGSSEEEAHGRKRLKGVVVDGKVVALLKDLGACSNSHDVLKSTPGIAFRLVTNREAQNEMRMFSKLFRSVTAAMTARGRDLHTDAVHSAGGARYIVVHGVCHICVGALLKHGNTRTQRKASKLTNYVAIIKAGVDLVCCLCSALDRCNAPISE